MHSRTWTLMALLAAAAPAASAADMRVVADDAWCREDGANGWGGRRASYCEVRETELTPQGALQVDARPNGGIQVQGWERNAYRLRVRVTAIAATVEEARALAGQVRVETGGAVRATGPDSRSRERQWWASFRLDVPRNADLDLEADNGGLHLAGFTGHAKLGTVNGGIHLEGVGGHIEGSTTNGGLHVSLSGTEWQGEGLDVSTTNGGVHLEIPAGYNARLETGTVNGGIHSDLPVSDRRRGQSGGRIATDLGRGGPLLHLETTNGGVHVSQE